VKWWGGIASKTPLACHKVKAGGGGRGRGFLETKIKTQGLIPLPYSYQVNLQLHNLFLFFK